jgi:RNA polymerase sigma-70 factor, ECF subfamily
MPSKLRPNKVQLEAISMPGGSSFFRWRGPQRPQPATGAPRADERPSQSAGDGRRLPPLEPEATLDLLERVRHGDDEALEALFIRCLPSLRRWARGRLPLSARGMHDTVDLVQDTLLAALRQLKSFDARHQGALQAYLRQAIMNRIRDLVRQRDRRPIRAEMPEALVDEAPSPLALAIGAQNQAVYEQALKRLRPADREAIINRLELQHSYEELAVLLDKRSPDAARVAVMRAMKRLVEEMRSLSAKRG